MLQLKDNQQETIHLFTSSKSGKWSQNVETTADYMNLNHTLQITTFNRNPW